MRYFLFLPKFGYILEKKMGNTIQGKAVARDEDKTWHKEDFYRSTAPNLSLWFLTFNSQMPIRNLNTDKSAFAWSTLQMQMAAQHTHTGAHVGQSDAFR